MNLVNDLTTKKFEKFELNAVEFESKTKQRFHEQDNRMNKLESRINSMQEQITTLQRENYQLRTQLRPHMCTFVPGSIPGQPHVPPPRAQEVFPCDA